MDSAMTRPRLWRWILGTIFIVTTWQVLGLLLTFLLASIFDLNVELLFSTADEDLAAIRALPAWSSAATVLISFLPLLAATLLAYRIFLKKNIKSLFTNKEKYSYKRTWIGFASLALISIAFGAIDLILNWDSYTFSFKASAFLPYLLIALTLLPMQTTAEELFFRGWIQRWLDNGKQKQWSISILSGAIFSLPHLANPEVAGNELFLPIISYGATGFMLAWVTYRDKSLELAIGAHFANNLLAALLVSSQDSALPSVSLLTVTEVVWGPAALVSVIMVPIFIWLTGRWGSKTY
ncbi:MAG: CPBP family intramembrane metalloprotease [Actinobacteria bacterium]|nr:CPBP family intramembrane metalloprotease [Actinomycetota bacterium]